MYYLVPLDNFYQMPLGLLKNKLPSYGTIDNPDNQNKGSWFRRKFNQFWYPVWNDNDEDDNIPSFFSLVRKFQ